MSTEITIHGNLVAEPTIARVGEKQIALSKLRVASSRRRKTEDKDPNGRDVWVDIDQLYIDVACWGALAVNVKASLFRGCPVVITGRLLTETWEEESDGKTQTRSRIVMRASRVAFDLSTFQINSRKTTNVSHTVEGTDEVRLKSLDDLLAESNQVQRNSADDDLPPRKQFASSFEAPQSASQPQVQATEDDEQGRGDKELVGAAVGGEGDEAPF